MTLNTLDKVSDSIVLKIASCIEIETFCGNVNDGFEEIIPDKEGNVLKWERSSEK